MAQNDDCHGNDNDNVDGGCDDDDDYDSQIVSSILWRSLPASFIYIYIYIYI